MQRRRQREKLKELTRGPGRLCQAMAIDRELDGCALTDGAPLWIASDGEAVDQSSVAVSPRIGISSAQLLPLRFFLADSPYVSGPRRLRTGK